MDIRAPYSLDPSHLVLVSRLDGESRTHFLPSLFQLEGVFSLSSSRWGWLEAPDLGDLYHHKGRPMRLYVLGVWCLLRLFDLE